MAKQSRDISFGSFNLYNLQSPGENLYGNSTPWSEAQYQNKINFTGQMFNRMNADVIGLQELWSPQALADAQHVGGLTESHVALTPPEHQNNRIVCAALVRRQILVGEPRWITDFPPEMHLFSGGEDPQQARIAVNLSSFSRPVLHFQVQPSDTTPQIHVFVCHFKSRRPTTVYHEDWYKQDAHSSHRKAVGYALSTIRRTAEATALRILITEISKNTDVPVVVIGDMNDGKDTNTLAILTEQPRFLTTLSAGGRDNALYSTQILQAYRSTRDVYYTYIYQDQHDSLDHILVSEQFYDNARKRLWRFDGMTVANDHLDDIDHKVTGSNDHGIITARFKWDTYQ